MVKVTQKHDECIGCGACAAVCPDSWEMGEGGKALPKGAKKNSQGDYELEVEKIGCNKDAADSCPVQIIKIS